MRKQKVRNIGVMSDLISVIMSTYNEKLEWIEESINSILEQTYKNIEFIIVLDNPKNKPLKDLLIAFSEKDNRIKLIINNENMGLVRSLNIALQHCNGKYIARMDADDISYSQRLSLQKDFLEKNNLDFIFSGVKLINENSFELYDTNNELLNSIITKQLLEITNISNHPTWFLKAEIYKKLNGYRDIPYCEDYDFSLRCLISNVRIGKMDKNVLKYRVRSSSISRSNSLEQYLNSKSLRKLYKENKLNNINEVEKFLNHNKILANNVEKEKFNKAEMIASDAIYNLKENNLLNGAVKFLKSIIISNYYRSKFFDIVKYKFLKSFSLRFFLKKS